MIVMDPLFSGITYSQFNKISFCLCGVIVNPQPTGSQISPCAISERNPDYMKVASNGAKSHSQEVWGLNSAEGFSETDAGCRDVTRMLSWEMQ